MKILGRESSLSRQLEQAYARMAALNPQRDGMAVYKQVLAAQPELADRLARMAQERPRQPGYLDSLQQSFGAKLQTRNQELPFYVTELITQVNNRHTTAALRCAIVSVLAFLTQPNDIMPSTADEGYGFLDDAAMVDAALLLVLQTRGARDAQLLAALQQCIDATVNFLPPASRERMRSAIQGVSDLFTTMAMLPDEVANAATLQFLDDPGLMTAPAKGRQGHPRAGYPSPSAASRDEGSSAAGH